MKTVILSSAHAIAGNPTDCQIEVKEGLLDSFKKYRARLRWFQFTPDGLLHPDIKAVYVAIQGLEMQDTYCNIPNFTPFAALNTGDWMVEDVAWPLLCEPRHHERVVTVSNNILRIRLFNNDFTSLSGFVTKNWTMEVQFDEL